MNHISGTTSPPPRRLSSSLSTTLVATIAAVALLASLQLGLESAGANKAQEHRAQDPGSQSVEGAGPGLISTHSCADMDVLPSDTEINTVLDAEHGTIDISFTSPEDGIQRSYVVDYKDDTACQSRADIRQMIDHAMAVWDETLEQTCRDLAAFRNSGRDLLDGVKVNQVAVVAYLQQWCL